MQGYKVFKKVNSEKRFGKVLNIVYHAEGHLAIGEDCKKNANDSDTPMVYSEVSARDPTFYRLTVRKIGGTRVLVPGHQNSGAPILLTADA